MIKCDVCGTEYDPGDGYEVSLQDEVIWNYCSRVCMAKDWHNYFKHFVAYGFITEEEANYPCIKCGRTDLPLFWNRMCPECYDPEDEEKKK